MPFISQSEVPQWLVDQCAMLERHCKGLQCKNKSGPVVQLSVDVLSMEHLQEWTLNQQAIAWQVLPCAIYYSLEFLCVSFALPWRKPSQLIYYHTCCPQGMFPNDLSLTLCYYHSLPLPFESYLLPAFFLSEFQGAGEAEFNYSFIGCIMLWHWTPRLGYKESFIISCNETSFLMHCEF